MQCKWNERLHVPHNIRLPPNPHVLYCSLCLRAFGVEASGSGGGGGRSRGGGESTFIELIAAADSALVDLAAAALCFFCSDFDSLAMIC